MVLFYLPFLLPVLTMLSPVLGQRVTAQSQTTQEVLDKALAALGGADLFPAVSGLILSAPNIFRSQTLTQSYKLNYSDVSLAISGSQTISYNYGSGPVQQAIDREYQLSEYWYWSHPALEPVHFSLVVQEGDQPFAWFHNGTNNVVGDGPTQQYADPGLTQYLVHNAAKTDPLLLYHIAQTQQGSTDNVTIHINGVEFPSIFDEEYNLTVAFNPETYLPWIVRSTEYSQIFGPSTRDVYLTDYRPVNVLNANRALMIPHRYQQVYNGETTEDTILEGVVVNPNFPAGTFDAQSGVENGSSLPLETDVSKIGQFYDTAMWPREFLTTFDQVNATHPNPDLPQLWRLIFSDSDGTASQYTQLVVELESGVLVTDAPDQLSQVMLDWIKVNIGKPVTHLWLSHHHHDHSYGTSDYVAAGAQLVIPEVARAYWSNIPNIKILTFNEDQPFILADNDIQVRAIWRHGAPHAEDWSWLVVTKACPTETDKLVIFEADVFDPYDSDGSHYSATFARQWLRWLDEDGVRNDTIVTPAHGTVEVLQNLIDIQGYVYPPHRLDDFKVGGDLCLSQPRRS